MFHKSKLKLEHKPQFPKQKEKRPRPLPEIINGDEEHKEEEIQDVWLTHRKKQFLVKWKGLPKEESTWEPETNLKNAWGAIRDFYKKLTVQAKMEKSPSPPSLHRLPNVHVPNVSLSPLHTPAHLLPLYTPHPRLFGWDNDEFQEEYHKKLEWNWQRWKSACEEAYQTWKGRPQLALHTNQLSQEILTLSEKIPPLTTPIIQSENAKTAWEPVGR